MEITVWKEVFCFSRFGVMWKSNNGPLIAYSALWSVLSLQTERKQWNCLNDTSHAFWFSQTESPVFSFHWQSVSFQSGFFGLHKPIEEAHGPLSCCRRWFEDSGHPKSTNGLAHRKAVFYVSFFSQKYGLIQFSISRSVYKSSSSAYNKCPQIK